MKPSEITGQLLNGKQLNQEEGLEIYNNMPLPDIMFIAGEIRKKLHSGNIVTWQIDRNVNISNICYVGCKFCNFSRKQGDRDIYITKPEEYVEKIEELFTLGGNQLLLQGGMNPSLGIDFYKELFKYLKAGFPGLKLHALGPPEIVFLARKEKMSYTEVLETLIESGLDSLPGAGAEILSDRVRTVLSKGKCSSDEWLSVMRAAHRLGLYTSATMMFGHIETYKERLTHLIKIRELQDVKPAGMPGFTAFIPWPVQLKNTELSRSYNIKPVHASEYLRMIAISRIMLNNIPNIQASWLTVGRDIAGMALHGGANDLGSVMIEENVVSAAGASNKISVAGIQELIKDFGFIPRKRNQRYEFVD